MNNNDLNNAKLSEDALEGVSGGFIYFNQENSSAPYELIDDLTGDLLGAFSSKQDCIDSAKFNNINTRDITKQQLNQIRGRI